MYFLCKLGEFAQGARQRTATRNFFQRPCVVGTSCPKAGGPDVKLCRGGIHHGIWGVGCHHFCCKALMMQVRGTQLGWGCWWVILPGCSRVQPLPDSATKWPIHFSWCLVFLQDDTVIIHHDRLQEDESDESQDFLMIQKQFRKRGILQEVLGVFHWGAGLFHSHLYVTSSRRWSPLKEMPEMLQHTLGWDLAKTSKRQCKGKRFIQTALTWHSNFW